MKGFKTILLIFVLILYPASRGLAGSFMNITGIDTQTNFPWVKIWVTIKGLNENERDELGEENFLVYEDAYRIRPLKVMKYKSDDLFYLVFSIDSSKSINKQFLKNIKESAREIIENATPDDKMAIYEFSNGVRLLTPFSERKKVLVKYIDKIERHGTKTMLYNAIYDSIELLDPVKSTQKKIVVFTDGLDDGSSVNENDIVVMAQKSRIPIFFFTIRSSGHIRNLGRIAKLTGGTVVYGDRPDDFAELYDAVFSGRKSSYKIEYKPTRVEDSDKHKIEVQLKWHHVRDNDIQDASFGPAGYVSKFRIFTPYIFYILILLLAMTGSVILTLFFLRLKSRLKSKHETPDTVTRDMTSGFEKTVELDDNQRKILTPVILENDAEYSYSFAWLVQKNGPESGKKFPIFWDEITIGRGKENSIVLNDNSVSLNHAKIKKVRNVYHLFDLISDNGTFLNAKKMLRPRPLNDWDEIRIGRIHFIFRGAKNK